MTNTNGIVPRSSSIIPIFGICLTIAIGCGRGAVAAEAVPDPAGQPKVETITVGTTDELIKAIGPNRVVVLRPGRYVLKQPLQAKKIDRLTIKAKPGEAIVEVDDAGSPAAYFTECKELKLQGLTLGHTAEAFKRFGVCTGEVLRLDGCENTTIEQCDLYGCGQQGLLLHGCRDLRVTNSRIHDCSGMLFTAADCTGLRFERTSFDSNRLELYGIVLRHCPDTVFESCRISNNQASRNAWVPVLFAMIDRKRPPNMVRFAPNPSKKYEAKQPVLTTVQLKDTVYEVPRGFSFSTHEDAIDIKGGTKRDANKSFAQKDGPGR